MVEAHGTSTRVGDVVEVDSLNAVFGSAPCGTIALGSVKSNIGHLKAGVGAAGLLKAILSLDHKMIPPTLHSETPNPDIPFAQTPFYLVHEPREMKTRDAAPRRVGVSAYGFGGTNYHVVLEEHLPGMLTDKKVHLSAVVEDKPMLQDKANSLPPSSSDAASFRFSGKPSTFDAKTTLPPRGILALGAMTPNELQAKLDEVFQRVSNGWTPPVALPGQAELKQRERIVLDFGNHEELVDRLDKARQGNGI